MVSSQRGEKILPEATRPDSCSPGRQVLAAGQDALDGAALAGGLGAAAKSLRAGGAAIEEGASLFRVFGGESRAMGRSWTTTDPSLTQNYRGAAGLPSTNTGQFVVEGKLTNVEGVIVKPAVPGPSTVHGQRMVPEVVVPDPVKQVKVTNASGQNPPF